MLIDKLSSPDFLETEAWAGLNKSNPESYGLSKETIAQFKSEIQTRLVSISKSLKDGSYKFLATRASIIPKDNGKYRPLQVPEIQDRLVLKGLAIILEKELSSLLKDSVGYSFAYQTGIGVRDAVNKMKEYYNLGNKFIYEADIINFFPTVDRNPLLKKIFAKLPDESLNNLIAEGISQPVGGIELIKSEHQHLFNSSNKYGIPQGNPLSPLFSNLYLAPFDLVMKQNNFLLIRYADDFIVLCKTIQEANKAYEISKYFLENNLSLKVHELDNTNTSKTRIIEPDKTEFSFLSVAFDGKDLFPSRKSVNKFIANIETLCNAKSELTDVYTTLMKLKFSIEGWVATYFYTNLERYFEEIDSAVNEQLLRALRKLGWKLSAHSISKVKFELRKTNEKGIFSSGDCLSNEQRKNSGVPFCQQVLIKHRGNLNSRLPKISSPNKNNSIKLQEAN